MRSQTRTYPPINEQERRSNMNRASLLLLALPLLACLGTVDAVKVVRAKVVDEERKPYSSCEFGVLGSTTEALNYESARLTGEGSQLEAVIRAGGGWSSIELKIRCKGSDTVLTERVGWWRGSTVDLGTVVLQRSEQSTTR